MRGDGEENGAFTWDVVGTSRSNLSQEDVGDDPHWKRWGGKDEERISTDPFK